MDAWISAALGLGAGWLLSQRRRVFRRTYRALLCREHGLFNPETLPFCPICEQELQPVSLFRRLTVDMGDSGNCTGGRGFNRLENFRVSRTAAVGVGSKGFNLHNACWTIVSNTQSSRSVSNYYVNRSADVVIERSQAAWSDGDAVPMAGFEVDSSGGTSNASTTLRHDVVANSGTNKTAFYIHGDSVADILATDLNAASTDNGLVITSTGAGCGSCNTDLHFSGLIFDNLGVVGVQVNNVFAGAGGLADINIEDAYIGVSGLNGRGLDIENSQGVKLVNSHMRVPSGTGVLINGAQATDNTVDTTTIRLSPTGIALTGGASKNHLTNNTLYHFVTGMSFAAGSNLNIATGNVFDGNGNTGTGISVATGANNNRFFPFSMDTVATPYVNLGTGNDFGPATIAMLGAIQADGSCSSVLPLFAPSFTTPILSGQAGAKLIQATWLTCRL